MTRGGHTGGRPLGPAATAHVGGALVTAASLVAGISIGTWYADVHRLSGFARLAALQPIAWAAVGIATLLAASFLLRRRRRAEVPWLILAAAVLPIAAIVAGTVSYDALGTPSDLVLPPGMQTPQGTSPP